MRDRERERVSWVNAKYGMILSTPYHKDFLEKLKEVIPEEEHHWRGNGRWISDAYIQEAKSLVFEFFEQ